MKTPSGDLVKAWRNIYISSKEMALWKWDNTFQAALCEFPAFSSNEFLTILVDNFTCCWDGNSIAAAPKDILQLADRLGGLQADQLILCSDAGHDTPALGAFWPWQNSETVSIRIFLHMQGSTDHNTDNDHTIFRNLFNIN